jgi:hypothetical protein
VLLSVVVVGLSCDLLPGNCSACLVAVVPFSSLLLLSLAVFAVSISLYLSIPVSVTFVVVVVVAAAAVVAVLVVIVKAAIPRNLHELGFCSDRNVVRKASGCGPVLHNDWLCYYLKGLLHSTVSQIACTHL